MAKKEKKHNLGIIMNGVTGRMGTNQHLMRSIVPIIRQGGVAICKDEFVIPDPVLIGRNPEKLKHIAQQSGIKKWSTDLDSVLKDDYYKVYFDAQKTGLREDNIEKAARAGKHIYCEKPLAVDTKTAMNLYNICEQTGVKHGIVQDKLWLPGLIKMKKLIENGFFGRILSVKGDFGYWVFNGQTVPAQRPSWNYRKEENGGIILDMMCHWRYILDNLFGNVKSVTCVGATQIPERFDENGQIYKCSADDAAYAIFQLEGDIIAQFNFSWNTRVRRDDLLVIQVDGVEGSAVAGLRKCWKQHLKDTPVAKWNPDIEQQINFYESWSVVPDEGYYDNAFKVQWELFLKHVMTQMPFRWNLKEGAKGVQLAEKAIDSWTNKTWVEIPEL
jgi:predicted dehydrogenase